MSPTGPSPEPAQLDLLAMARAVRAAVARDDTQEMHRQLARLRSGLVDHLGIDHRHLAEAGEPVRFVIAEGQQRILRLLDEVLVTSEEPDRCNCLVRAADIELSLRRQAAIEEKVSRRST